MAIERPAILIIPMCNADDEDLVQLANDIRGAVPGQVLWTKVQARVLHLIDGLWIESGDLPKVLEKAGDGVQ